jgi:hypothetical protein
MFFFFLETLLFFANKEGVLGFLPERVQLLPPVCSGRSFLSSEQLRYFARSFIFLGWPVSSANLLVAAFHRAAERENAKTVVM